jgi:hypothetical protein
MSRKQPTVEVSSGESAEIVAERIRKVLKETLKGTSKQDLLEALSTALANIITVEFILHDLLLGWRDMSDSKRKRVITLLAHQMSLASGTEYIEMPERLQ